ncbi:MAG: pyruvate dehydrogenase complex dihydrolipoamide acetyltransferase [Alphaproteobacteria bacterium CG_4_10_14_0_8_um_filter_53_9]|nr:MAG: pyruvate dehydrogenase complex dihydrolipoamide acetyltransferase [Alphaproteobacteria bacterium CG_4_10_14_0_8_um_filter_53_9]
MPIDVLMPQLSPTMTEGRLAKWLKAPGDELRVGDVMAEVETDKATMEVEATGDGILHLVIGEVGADLAVGTPIAVIARKGEEVPADYAPVAKLIEKKEEAPRAPAASGAKAGGPGQRKGAPAREGRADPSSFRGPELTAGAMVGAGMVEIREGHVAATPLARKMADARGLPLGGIMGTGPRGRVVAYDVENAARVIAIPMAEGAPSAAAPAGVLPEVREGDTVEKLSPMRKAIAAKLTMAKQTVPHFYLTRSASMAAAMAWRAGVNEKLAADGVKLSVNDLIIRACALALRDHPAANAAWNGDSLVMFGNVDISVAVSIDGGLVTPIVADAANKGLPAISSEMKELAGAARAGKLKPHQYEGGSFSISNLGMYGIEEFSAIINPPQAAILAVGATVDGRMKMTLSVDHRVIDGALGAELLGSIVGYLEQPEKLEA